MAKTAAKAAPKPTGRPTRYDPELAKKVLYLISQGESLQSICKKPGMPKFGTFRSWVNRDYDGLMVQYVRARTLRTFWHADEIVDIADRDDLDPQDKRIRIDSRKWLLSKLLPKQYGPKALEDMDEPHEGSSTDEVPTIPAEEQERTAGPVVIMAVEPDENYLPQSAPAAADVTTIDIEPNRKVAK